MTTRQKTSNWLLVEFNCSNGWDKVITSIPASEKDTAIAYLQGQKFTNISNLKFL